MSLTLTAISALEDNYIWVVVNHDKQAIIVDPGESAPILAAINEHGWQPHAILLTHHHADHVGGVEAILQQWPNLIVYGPQETLSKGATHLVSEGDHLNLLGTDFRVIATPGHTLGHVAFYADPYLFCGDTLFSAGCGRLFEGSPEQMYQSLNKLDQLPKETLICCAHEYTLSNLKFAHQLLPNNKLLTDYYQKVQKLRANQQITLPTTLETERLINVFLNTENSEIIDLFADNPDISNGQQRFSELRRLKDNA